METAVSPVVYTVNGKISQFILQPADTHGEPLGVFLIDKGGISATGKGFAQGHAVDAAGESIAGEGGGDDPKESENTKNE